MARKHSILKKVSKWALLPPSQSCASIFLSLGAPFCSFSLLQSLPKVVKSKHSMHGDSSTCNHLQGWHIKGSLDSFLYLVHIHWLEDFLLWEVIIGNHWLLQALTKAYIMGPKFWTLLFLPVYISSISFNIPFCILFSLSVFIK